MRKLFWELVHKQPWSGENNFEASMIYVDDTSAIYSFRKRPDLLEKKVQKYGSSLCERTSAFRRVETFLGQI